MEIILVILLLVSILIVKTFGIMWIWIGVLAIAFYIGQTVYRVRCQSCGKKPITVNGMRFCNQCGAEQTPKWIRIRCDACKRIVRSELNMSYCNCCGVKLVYE